MEVRTRQSRRDGNPEELITGPKRLHLSASAQSYLQEQGLEDFNCRIDRVAVKIGPKNELGRLKVLENVVNAL